MIILKVSLWRVGGRAGGAALRRFCVSRQPTVSVLAVCVHEPLATAHACRGGVRMGTADIYAALKQSAPAVTSISPS